MGSDIAVASNLLSLCDKGHLPVAGGLLDQSKWFIEFWQTMASECNKIDLERIEKD